MPRIVPTIAAALALGLAPAIAAAEDYVDRDNGFRVTVPAGWEKVADEAKELDLILVSPRFDSSGGVCAVTAEDLAETRQATQDELNEAMAGEIDEAFWRSIVADDDTKDVTIDTAKSEIKDGRRVYTATARYTTKEEGADVKLLSHFALHLLPGRMLMTHCGVTLTYVAVEQADMKVVLDSAGPLGEGVIAGHRPQAPQTTAALVLYAGSFFDGPRRVLTQDVPNLAQAGWSGWTASFSLKGAGLWEICDGIHYRGNCRVIAGASSAKLGDRALRIGSARRIVSPRDPRSALGLIADALAGAKRHPRGPRRR